MIFPKPIIDDDARIDFYAGTEREYQKLWPLYQRLIELGRQGAFFASRSVNHDGLTLINSRRLDGLNPIVIASYKDLNDVFVIGEERPFIVYETEHNTETRGLLDTVTLFLCRDERTLSYRRAITDEAIKVESDDDAVAKLLAYCKGKEVQYYAKVDGHSIGIVYLAFGRKAGEAIQKSQASLRRLGYRYPVAIVGDKDGNVPSLKDAQFIEWEGDNPFDVRKAKNFKFRAGRVKPHLAKLSPFDFTLYLDADTQFVRPIHHLWDQMHDVDLFVTEEKLTLKDLYNKARAGWELNMTERDTTMIEIGDLNGSQRFINSGVMLFKKGKRLSRLFADWYKEWERFQEWDEQLALMRAIHNNPDVTVKRLSVEYNYPQYRDGIYIFHHYGHGDVRMNP